ncbi:MAG TPA: hypothetical protein VHY79_03050, partial [Rhizomicrobium sp.]|nr:hypothetical protein [Rhizomicrobium sp.]
MPVSGLHRPAARFVLAGEVWEAPTLDLMIAECGTGDIIHAGTFFGDFLPGLSAGVADGAKIWAFEPHPESFRCALLTVLLNDLENIELSNAGVGDRQESGLLVTRDFDGISLGGASQILPGVDEQRDIRGTNRVPTSLVTLDKTIPSDRTVSIL